MTRKVSDADLAAFVAAARETTQLDLGHDEIGQRYARVFNRDPSDHSGRHVFCFIDLTNGNVLRPDSWKRPNLKVRNSIQGNIYDDQRGCGLMRAGEDRLWRSPEARS
ncbi:hypothetical protein AB7M49_006098 [Bradyrhizobium elkanii]